MLYIECNVQVGTLLKTVPFCHGDNENVHYRVSLSTNLITMHNESFSLVRI